MRLTAAAKYALLGGLTGYAIVHPLVMGFSHLMFETPAGVIHLQPAMVFAEFLRAFAFRMVLWSLSFAASGAMIGYLYGNVQAERRRLQAANGLKDKFLSILAHDLKNPLNIVLIALGMLVEEPDTLNAERRQRYLRNSYDSTRRLYALLEDLLAWARLQTGRMPWNPENTPLASLAQTALAPLYPGAEKKQIVIDTTISAETTIYADLQMVMLVIRNLVSNAIKFTKPGGCITLTSRTIGSLEEITITDTGVGIAPDNLPKLFCIDKMYSTTGTAEEVGTGLGLILCQEFVEKHGGTIGVASVIGQGSTFTFTLPKSPLKGRTDVTST